MFTNFVMCHISQVFFTLHLYGSSSTDVFGAWSMSSYKMGLTIMCGPCCASTKPLSIASCSCHPVVTTKMIGLCIQNM